MPPTIPRFRAIVPIPARAQLPGTTPPASIDWAREAEIAAADRLSMDLETSRQGAALSRWRQKVMPAARQAAKSTFAWDPSRTQRVVTTIPGLVVNLSDRCALLISVMAIMGGCKVGQMPIHGDLFAHMSDVPMLGDAANH
ncbi:MAG TPA: hypothetical protein VGV09_08445 [Steroidobacteraceae bacterium]|nr:hypothetical protein [Steroidobacteraceae bacterium]